MQFPPPPHWTMLAFELESTRPAPTTVTVSGNVIVGSNVVVTTTLPAAPGCSLSPMLLMLP